MVGGLATTVGGFCFAVVYCLKVYPKDTRKLNIKTSEKGLPGIA